MKRRTHDEFETRQVAPAPPGWRAVYALGPDDELGEPFCFDPVVAFGEIWARTWICDEHGAHVRVERHWYHLGWEPLVLDQEVGTLDRAAALGNFIGLVAPDEDAATSSRLAEAREAHLAQLRRQGAPT